MVTTVSSKRSCEDFEVPWATVRLKRPRLPFFPKHFSEPCALVNLSKGGMSFECHQKLARGMKVTVQLLVPGSAPLNLRATVAWYGHVDDEMTTIATINFLPFGKRKEENPDESLEVLRKLEEDYGKEQATDQFHPVRDHLF
jgi:hypothetical protein